MEKWPLTPEIVKQKINEKAEDLGYEITPEISMVLEDIIKDLPQNISPRGLTEWCSKRVDEAIQSRPDLIGESERLRYEVGREIRYVQREEAFRALKNKIIDEDIKEVTPAWLESNDRPIHRFVCTFFKKYDSDEVDWDFFARKMDIEDRFKKIRPEVKKGLTFEERISEIEKVLEEKGPESFGPRWLVKNCFSEYRYFFKNLESKNGVVDWSKVINKLPEKWQKRWFVLESKRGFDLEGRIQELISVLEEKDPNTFGPSWIFKNARSEHRYFITNLKSENGVLKWNEIIEKLPEKWQKRWVYMETRDLLGDNLGKEIAQFISDFKVKKITRKFLEENDHSLYQALVNRLGKGVGGNIAWERITDILPPDVAEKIDLEKNNIMTGFSHLADYVKSQMKEGDILNPSFLNQNMERVSKFLARHFRDSNGKISWPFIMRTFAYDYGIPIDESLMIRESGVTYKKMVDRINYICKKEQPKRIDTQFFTENDPYIYNGLFRYAHHSDGSLNWDIIFREVDEPYKSMWFEREKNRHQETRNVIVNDFKALLEKEDPKSLSPKWIRNTSSNLYNRIVNNFCDRYGEVDWNKFKKAIPLLWRNRWIETSVIEKYRNKEELDVVLSKYKDEMYVLFMNGKKEMERGEEIWADLIKLAQKGNQDAYDVVSRIAGEVVDDYIKNKEDPDDSSLYLELDKDVKEKVIDRCIRLYKPDIEGYFKNYLLKSIGFNIKKRGYKYSMDNKKDDETSLHERLSDDGGDDSEDFDNDFN